MMARILISSGHTLVASFHARQNSLELEKLLHLFSVHLGLVSFQEQVSPIQLATRRWGPPSSQGEHRLLRSSEPEKPVSVGHRSPPPRLDSNQWRGN